MLADLDIYRCATQLIATGLILLSTTAAASDIRVIDGDTLEENGVVYRLWGIDAPEADQVCADGYPAGAMAIQELQSLVQHFRQLVCDLYDVDQYGQHIVRCVYRDTELAAQLVRAGIALDWPQYSDGEFAADQAYAVDNRHGVWAHDCMAPWEWRRR